MLRTTDGTYPHSIIISCLIYHYYAGKDEQYKIIIVPDNVYNILSKDAFNIAIRDYVTTPRIVSVSEHKEFPYKLFNFPYSKELEFQCHKNIYCKLKLSCG